MKKIAFVFPGQGSQSTGMGKDLYDNFDIAKKIFDNACEITGIDYKKLCFEGSDEELKITYNTQPAIFITSAAAYFVLKEKNILPSYVAGHSLGEYNALLAANVLSFEDALKIVKYRAELMHQAAEQEKGSMAAIMKISEEELLEICKSIDERVQPAAFNSPGQIVVSGPIESVNKVVSKCKELKYKAIELKVSGAWHSPLMKSAEEQLKELIERVEFKKPEIPVVLNSTAKITDDVTQIKTALINQLTKPVLWVKTIELLLNEGVELFIETGPSKVLSGLIQKINKDINVINFSSISDFENIEKNV
ncbi:MAG TPA: ACP S-malonyltransferase [bacterium]|nr:ACP S-malonyltransferase [bacterium]HOL47831.1 ACP S-malonyltransferase [bacterium]HPQ19544.1 ACP S-malonyltransferase [bacterium]